MQLPTSTEALSADLIDEDDERLTPGPQTLGDYIVTGRLGGGGMADVFLAQKMSKFGYVRRAVIKRVKRSKPGFKNLQRMLLDEARATACFDHPNLVSILDVGEDEQGVYLALEYVDGTDLRWVNAKLRTRKEALPFELACFLCGEVLRGLHHAHNARGPDGQPLEIVHRDVNPANILISQTGHVKLADFGVVRMRDRVQQSTEAGLVKGKYGYLAPEYIAGESCNQLSDVYATGIMLFELLSGRECFSGTTTYEVMWKIVNRGVPLYRLEREGVPEDLGRIVQKATNPVPERRYGSAQEMANALETWLMRNGKHATPWVLSVFFQRHGLYPERADQPAIAASTRESIDDDHRALMSEPTPAPPLLPASAGMFSAPEDDAWGAVHRTAELKDSMDLSKQLGFEAERTPSPQEGAQHFEPTLRLSSELPTEQTQPNPILSMPHIPIDPSVRLTAERTPPPNVIAERAPVPRPGSDARNEYRPSGESRGLALGPGSPANPAGDLRAPSVSGVVQGVPPSASGSDRASIRPDVPIELGPRVTKDTPSRTQRDPSMLPTMPKISASQDDFNPDHPTPVPVARPQPSSPRVTVPPPSQPSSSRVTVPPPSHSSAPRLSAPASPPSNKNIEALRASLSSPSTPPRLDMPPPSRAPELRFEEPEEAPESADASMYDRATPTPDRIDEGPRGSVPWSGKLEEISAADALDQLTRAGASGSLEFRCGLIWKRVQLDQGAPIAITSNMGMELIGEHLVKARLISRRELDRALHAAERDGTPLTLKLLELDLIEKAQLEEELGKNLAARLSEVLEWRWGTFEFTPQPPEPAALRPKLDLRSVIEGAVEARARSLEEEEAEGFQDTTNSDQGKLKEAFKRARSIAQSTGKGRVDQLGKGPPRQPSTKR